LLPWLKSNQIAILFTPYQYPVSENAGLGLFFPKTFIPRVGFGFHNQFQWYGPEYLQGYYRERDYPRYFENYGFTSYQQSLFLSFSVTQSFTLAPFYTWVKSPFEVKREYFCEYEYDTTYHHQSQTSYSFNDDITAYRFGLGAALKLKEDLLQLAVSLNSEKNKIDFDGEEKDYYHDTYYSGYTYDSSYDYHFYQHSDEYWEKDTLIQTKNGKEQRLNFRWRRETEDWLGFNLDLSKFSADLNGQELDTGYIENWYYNFERWRHYPNLESTETTNDTVHEYYRKSLNLAGKTEEINMSIATGCGIPITDFIDLFIGLKSVISLSKDSSQETGNKILATDTTSYEDSLITLQVFKSNKIIFSLPIGLEYQVVSPVFIRAGITPKFTYEKQSFKDETRVYSDMKTKNLTFNRSFGLGLKLNPNFTVDLYNKGNLLSLGEWFVQGRYRF
jgi:opacity protein-like surface antigen